MTRWKAVFGAMTAVVLASAPFAETRAQVDTHSGAPIDITANEAEVISAKCEAIWRGEAEALQGDTRLRAQTITVYSTPKGPGATGQQACGATDRVVADGQVYYVTPERNARSDHAVYSASADQIVLTGNVIVVQGNDVARGDKLTIKVSTKEATMASTATGLGKAGRVRGVFYPKKSDQPGQTASTAASAPTTTP